MTLELRPPWCLTDEIVESVLTLGPWADDHGRNAFNRDGDDWKPGDSMRLTRQVDVEINPIDLRRQLGLRAGASIGIAARWSCKATSKAGVHEHGPLPVELLSDTTLTIEVPKEIAESVEVETCLVVNWPSDPPPGSSPNGALVWSDGWSQSSRSRSILLEGDEARIPVRSVAFSQYFGRPSGALWAIELDPSIEADDLLSNVVTVLLNKEILDREFRGLGDEPDASLLPPATLAGVSVDLVRLLTDALAEELGTDSDWAHLGDGSVGSMVTGRLTEAFGSLEAALSDFSSDQAAFSRELWNRLAPDSWKGR